MTRNWRDDALCAQVATELFFPEGNSTTREAKAVCAACDVRTQCLEYALRNNETHGIYAGLSAAQRARLKRKAA